jgi:hypothetical protein
MGTENKDKLRGEEALRKIDANTLAACAKVRVLRARCGCGRVGRVRDSGMRCGGIKTELRRCRRCLMEEGPSGREGVGKTVLMLPQRVRNKWASSF